MKYFEFTIEEIFLKKLHASSAYESKTATDHHRIIDQAHLAFAF